ncbi:MAG: hypothetical protein WDZ28_04890, partial [Simkaniaceae bacterium]
APTPAPAPGPAPTPAPTPAPVVQNFSAGPIYIPESPISIQHYEFGDQEGEPMTAQEEEDLLSLSKLSEEIEKKKRSEVDSSRTLQEHWAEIKGMIAVHLETLHKDLSTGSKISDESRQFLVKIEEFKSRLTHANLSHQQISAIQERLDNILRPKEMSHQEWRKATGKEKKFVHKTLKELKMRAHHIRVKLQVAYTKQSKDFDPTLFALKDMQVLSQFSSFVKASGLPKADQQTVLNHLANFLKPKNMPREHFDRALSYFEEKNQLEAEFRALKPLAIKRKVLLARLLKEKGDQDSIQILKSSSFKKELREYAQLIFAFKEQLNKSALPDYWKEQIYLRWENVARPEILNSETFHKIIEAFGES